ncbi:T9SS type A sorting domain-containing protein [Hyunsoonleella aestuarii]|uniref:T9SS type A sorting domain-containing protein n=1 Tax=Hyunsoonleella aestuarii TaxID=912802 RepID=A0ABP8EDI3_9FLAO|nr:T9SS type A sorting domain-containing protein [Hyunsoonleella aestuarii]
MTKYYFKLSIVCLFFSISSLYSQSRDHNLINKISIDKQIELSDAIIEGEVISKKSYLDNTHSRISTSNIIKVYKVFKGELISESIEIITAGGVVDMKAVVVSHSLNLRKGDKGVFMLEKTKSSSTQNKSAISFSKFNSLGANQGFYKYDERNDRVSNMFSIIDNIKDVFYNEIISYSGKQPVIVNDFVLNKDISTFTKTNSSKSIMAPAIASFSATENSAGTKSVLTINGSGFGTIKGTVGFSNANYGGALHTDALDNQVLSWTDSKIEVEIPDEAGTGTFMVNTPSNGSIESNTSLTIDYSQINLAYDIGSGDEDFQTQHIDLNGMGGMSWTINEGFSTSEAMAPFESAMETWSCESGMNWIVGSTTTTSTLDSYDGVNLVTFGTLPLSTLGQTFSAYSACYQDGQIKWYVTDTDIIFNDAINWNFETNNPQSGEVDFESVTVHELGHAHQLGHVIDTNVVMHYSLSSGEMLRGLSNEDIMGSQDIQNRSSSSGICSQSLTINHACSGGNPGLSLADEELDQDITIFPNPVKDALHIKNSGYQNISKIRIFNILGKEVYKLDLVNNSRVNTINVSQYSRGIYLVKLNSEIGTVTKKIIIN